MTPTLSPLPQSPHQPPTLRQPRSAWPPPLPGPPSRSASSASHASGAAPASRLTRWHSFFQTSSTRRRPPTSGCRPVCAGPCATRAWSSGQPCTPLRTLCSTCCRSSSSATPTTSAQARSRAMRAGVLGGGTRDGPSLVKVLTPLCPWFFAHHPFNHPPTTHPTCRAECDSPYDTRFKPERLLIYDKYPGGIGLAAAVGAG